MLIKQKVQYSITKYVLLESMSYQKVLQLQKIIYDKIPPAIICIYYHFQHHNQVSASNDLTKPLILRYPCHTNCFMNIWQQNCNFSYKCMMSIIYNLPNYISLSYNKCQIYNPQMNNNSLLTRHCFSCGKEVQTFGTLDQLQKHQYPVCNQVTDSINIEKHFMCSLCLHGFESIKKFVKKHRIQWFNRNFKLDQYIESTLIKTSHIGPNFTKQSNRKSQVLQSSSPKDPQQDTFQHNHRQQDITLNLNLPNDIFSAVINNNIQSNYLHHIFWLPKTVQYFINLTSVERIRPQQRKQRVRKILQALSYLYCVDEREMRCLAIVVQTLLSYMDQDYLLKIVDRLLKAFLRNNVPLDILMTQQKTQNYSIDKSFWQTHTHKKPIQFRPDKLLQTIFSILIVSDFFKDSKLKNHIQEIVSLCMQEVTNKEHNNLHQSLQKTLQSYVKKNIPDNATKVSILSASSWQELIQVKRQKNQLTLIIKSIKRQQEENQQITKQIQTKFKKQKDQYVNKIIRLNNRIQQLENQLKSIKQNIQVQNKISRALKLNDLEELMKSNPQVKVNSQNMQEGKYQQVTEASQAETRQHRGMERRKSEQQQPKKNVDQKEQQELDCLKEILQITDIISFKYIKQNKKSQLFPVLQFPSTAKQLSKIIIRQIESLLKNVASLMQQNKKLKQQFSRVFAILKRKEEQWLPLFHQKDQIISLYEKALILLEKGVILEEQPLSSRIQNILEKVSSTKFIRFKVEQDDTSMRDSVKDSFIQDVPDSNLPKVTQKQVYSQNDYPPKQKLQPAKKSSKKNQTTVSGKIKKKTKRQKQKQTQCLIY